MESFFRYISYVDYYKRKERIKNVGFLRWKLHNNVHEIELQIKDILGVQGEFKIQEKNTGKIIDSIRIDGGIGSFEKKYTSMIASGEIYIEIQNDRIYLTDVQGFIVKLNENDYLAVDIDLKIEKKENNFQQRIQKREEVLEEIEAASENIAIERSKKQLDVLVEKESENYLNILQEKKSEKDLEVSSNKNMKIIEPIHDDKWTQLCINYQQVHPFQNNKIFLSIKPDDFIILQQEYQKLVHNSFLLHGFYNYGHMILGKLNDEEEAPVYIGVPGVYYEREKKAAQMFGFVGFESTEHPVQAGSYGYYMIEVEI